MDAIFLGGQKEAHIKDAYFSRFEKGTVLKQRVDTENVRHARLHKDRGHVLPNDKLMGIYLDYRGVPDLGTHEFIPQMRWSVIAEIDAKEALAPLVKIRLVFLMILFIVSIVGWLLGIFIAGTITRSLQELRKGAEIIGSGNLDYKTGINTKDEIGQLSGAFDAMLENLKNSVISKDWKEEKKGLYNFFITTYGAPPRCNRVKP